MLEVAVEVGDGLGGAVDMGVAEDLAAGAQAGGVAVGGEKAEEGAGDGGGLFGGGDVGGVVDDLEAGAGDGVAEGFGGGDGGGRVFGADDDQGRGGEAAGLAGQIGGGDGLAAGGVAFRRGGEDHGAEGFDRMGRGCRCDPAGQHGVDQRGHALGADGCGTLVPEAGGRDGERGVHQDECRDAVRGEVGELLGDQAADREADDSGLVDAELFEHGQGVVGEAVDRVGAGGGGGQAVTAHVGAEDAEAGGDQRGHDRIPDCGGRAERVQQENDAAVGGPGVMDLEGVVRGVQCVLGHGGDPTIRRRGRGGADGAGMFGND